MENSFVSICIPTYNGAAFIVEALDSAISQTYTNLEIIVSDDASTDDTLKIVEGYKNKTDIPIHIFHHQPKGIGANWNNCIAHAKGDYIKFLFQDDVLEPNCVETMMLVFQNNDQLGLIACKRQFIIEDGMDTPDMLHWIAVYGDLQKHLNLEHNHRELIFTKKLFGHEQFYSSPLNKIGEPSTVMFKKNILDKVGWFREDLKQLLDYEFCYRVLKQKNIIILDEKLVKFRLHSAQATQTNKGIDGQDYLVYDKLLYTDYFWLLYPKLQKRLFYKYHILPKFYRRIKQYIKIKLFN